MKLAKYGKVDRHSEYNSRVPAFIVVLKNTTRRLLFTILASKVALGRTTSPAYNLI